MATTRQTGGCSCGAIRFEAELDVAEPVSCTCKDCRSGGAGLFTKPAGFQLLQGGEVLGEDKDGSSHRHFCKRCGAPCFITGDIDLLGGPFVVVRASTLDRPAASQPLAA